MSSSDGDARFAGSFIPIVLGALMYSITAPKAAAEPAASEPFSLRASQAGSHDGLRGVTRVAIIDSGLNADDEVRQRVNVSDSGYNFGDCVPAATPECARGADSSPRDKLGHGTKVAKVFAEQLRDLRAATSFSVSVELVPIKINPGMMDDFSSAAVVSAIEHAVRLGARVINLSIEMPDLAEVDRQVLGAAIDRAVNSGVVIVAAAGNRSGEGPYPAGHPNVIAVDGLDRDGRPLRVRRAGRGLSISASALSAPGLDAGAEDGYSDIGTSFAAPRVAAAAALIVAAGPCLSPREVRDLLVSSGDPIHAGDGTSTIAVNPARAVALAALMPRLCAGPLPKSPATPRRPYAG